MHDERAICGNLRHPLRQVIQRNIHAARDVAGGPARFPPSSWKRCVETIRRLIYGEILLTTGFVLLAFLALFFFFDFVEEFCIV